jgi:hypothetical protein
MLHHGTPKKKEKESKISVAFLFVCGILKMSGEKANNTPVEAENCMEASMTILWETENAIGAPRVARYK